MKSQPLVLSSFWLAFIAFKKDGCFISATNAAIACDFPD